MLYAVDAASSFFYPVDYTAPLVFPNYLTLKRLTIALIVRNAHLDFHLVLLGLVDIMVNFFQDKTDNGSLFTSACS
jgi:hypothetical protein